MKEFLDNLIKTNKIIIDNSEKYITHTRESYQFAEHYSTDKETWVGSIIVKNNHIISCGTNRFAPGVKQTKDRMQRPKKYLCQDHAERNAINLAAKNGKKTIGSTMFMPWIPCSACASAIITSGIKKLVIHYDECLKTPNDWLIEMKESISMLLEAQIQIIIITEKINNCKTKFRGEMWNP